MKGKDTTTILAKRSEMLQHAVSLLRIWGFLGDAAARKIRKRISKSANEEEHQTKTSMLHKQKRPKQKV